MSVAGWAVQIIGVCVGSSGIENVGRKMRGVSKKDEYGNRTRCRYCGSAEYGDCSKSPNGKHEHIMP